MKVRKPEQYLLVQPIENKISQTVIVLKTNLKIVITMKTVISLSMIIKVKCHKILIEINGVGFFTYCNV